MIAIARVSLWLRMAAWSLVLTPWLAADADAQDTGRRLTSTVVRALEGAGELVRSERTRTREWAWHELQLFDETYPITIDVVVSTHEPPRKVIYLLPGGGTSFRASFFSPRGDNLAQYFRERGYLVVGITPREDRIPSTTEDFTFAAGWGVAQHRRDIRAVISRIQRVTRLPYEVLGHSAGAVSALDYASKYSREIARVIALDIYSLDPDADPEGIAQAAATHAAHETLLGQGIFMDPANAGAGALASQSAEELRADSGASRADVGLSGNFTNEGLFYFFAIYSADLPGVHSELTGLPGDWPLIASAFAGDYTLAPDPLDDAYALTHVSRGTLVASSAEAGSGLYPIAFARDHWAVVAGNGAYAIDWSAIQTKLIWLNTELGYGPQTHGATLAREAGNPNVTVAVVPGYGHGDILLSRTARRDAWRFLR